MRRALILVVVAVAIQISWCIVETRPALQPAASNGVPQFPAPGLEEPLGEVVRFGPTTPVVADPEPVIDPITFSTYADAKTAAMKRQHEVFELLVQAGQVKRVDLAAGETTTLPSDTMRIGSMSHGIMMYVDVERGQFPDLDELMDEVDRLCPTN